MPCKKYQSLTGILTENKRLSRTRFGRRWTPRGTFCGFGLRADSGAPHQKWHAACFHARGCSPSQMLSAGGDNIDFHIRSMPELPARLPPNRVVAASASETGAACPMLILL